MKNWLKHNRAAVIVLVIAALLFVLARMAFAPKTETAELTGDYAEYENAVVVQVLSDSTEPDETADGGYRGEQLLLAEVKTGQYAGETMQVYNYVSPLYGVPLKVGDGCTLTISTYENGDVSATVYEYNRTTPVLIVLGLFLLITVLVGGKTGAKSLVGLLFTVAGVFLLLFPALMKGAPTLPTTFLLCVFVSAVSFAVLGGVEKKTVCAWLGTVAGMALALVKRYTERYYPEWYERYENITVPYSTYIDFERSGNAGFFRWSLDGSGVLTDPDGILDMSADEILSLLFGK